MSKETLIVFVYDLQYQFESNDNSNDSSSAVVYFHPHWVSIVQRDLLCGHICAVADSFYTFLGETKIIALQNGKFVVQKFGNYLLAIGSDQNLQNWILEQRFEMLTAWIELYHKDIKTIETTSKNRSDFETKLFHIFENLIKFLPNQFAMFQNPLHFSLPKSTSLLFLEAVQFLQYLRNFDLVLGGTILFENRIIATQFEPDLIRSLIQSDPYRVPTNAQQLSDQEQYQLLIVYLKNQCFDKLQSNNDDDQHINRDRSMIFTTAIDEESDSIIERKSNVVRPKTLNLLMKTTDNTYNERISVTETKIQTPFARKSFTNTPMVDYATTSGSRLIHGSKIMLFDTKNQRDINYEQHMQKNHARQFSNFFIDHLSINNVNLIRKSKSCNNLPKNVIIQSSTVLNRSRSFDNIYSTHKRAIQEIQLTFDNKCKFQKRSLYLPLKSFDNTNTINDTLLTPLMAKLTILTNENDKYDQNELITTKNKNWKIDNLIESSRNLIKTYLFIFGIKDLALYLILRCDNDQLLPSREFLNFLVRTTQEKFLNFETALYHCIELGIEMQSSSKDDYNFITIDSLWGPVKCVGLTTDTHENRTLAIVNETFLEEDNIQEFTIRTAAGVVYGNRNANMQTYFWQKPETTNFIGIPKPSDVFGTVQLAAKKHLYNDHSITLL